MENTKQVGTTTDIDTTKDDIRKAKRVLKEKEVYEKATQSWRKDVQEIWKAMNGELSENVYPWENPQFIPKMRTEVSFVTPFIFSGDPELEVQLVGDEDKEMAFLMDKILSYRFERNTDVYEAILAWVTQGVGLGTSLLKATWLFEAGIKIAKDRPVLMVPNILDLYFNPMIPTVEGQVSIIEKISMTIDDVKKSKIFNKNKDKVTASTNKDKTYGSESMNDVDLDDQDQLNASFEMVTLYERWSADEITTIADCAGGPILLRNEKNPYGFIPYAKFVFEREVIPNRFCGKGIGQNTLGLNEMFYDLFNMTMLNLKIIVNKMWRIDPGSRINPNDLIGRPGGTVRASKDEAEPIEQQDLKQSAFNMLDMISNEEKRASGATDLIQGSTQSRTMGQDQLAQSNVTNRFELVRRGLKAAISKIGNMVLSMELNNLQSVESEIMRIFPETERETVFSILTAEAPNLNFDVVVRGDTIVAANKDIQAKQMLDMYNLIAPTMTPQEQRTFAQEIARVRGIPNVKELIPDAPIQPPTMPGEEGEEEGPVDGNALPEQGGQITNEGINEATYGFEKPNSLQ